ncbi:unnamed protein product, partial [Phaeothamnion confervicola]
MAEKTVAVIGAGPAGLVAAKCMQDARLLPTVFDRAAKVGGMWNSDASLCWGSLRTNLSRHTCQFSDLPWRNDAADFPTQRQIEAYLTEYTAKFIPKEQLFLGTEVTAVTPTEGDRWSVCWRTSSAANSSGNCGDGGSSNSDGSSLSQQDSSESSAVFDHVVVASGFFSSPHAPDIPGLGDFCSGCGAVMHSSEYRSPAAFAGKRVLVLGASFSAVELAAEVAPHAAAVIHAVPRPLWVLPRYLPASAEGPESPRPAFLPLDLVLYRSTNRTYAKEV